jgi:hypothetical protein
MAEDYAPTVRIRRPAKVTTDARGRTVWADTVETAELELVSTLQLQKILESSDDDTRSAIQRIVAEEQEGVLARDPATGLFEIISDADLRAILDAADHPPVARRQVQATLEPVAPEAEGGDEELSLVRTQVLRKILARDAPGNAPKNTRRDAPRAALRTKDKSGGFDPYNSS